MKKVLSHTGYALAFAILCSGSGLFAVICPVGLPVTNRTGQTIYVNIARTPAPAGTPAQKAIDMGYKRIAHGDTVCFQAGRAVSHIIWVHAVDPSNNTLGNPALFDTGSSILDKELFLDSVIVAKTQTNQEPKPTTKLILVGKHKEQEVKTAYSLTRSHMREVNGRKELVPGTVRREASQRDGVAHLLNSVGIFE